MKFQLDHILSFREPRKRFDAFETIPRDVPSAYTDLLERIENSRHGDSELAIKILSWIYFSRRPLLMDELLEALAVEEGDSHLQREYMLDPADVINCCKSLVSFDDSSGLVRFAHYTVQEFLTKIEKKLLPSEHLGRVCVTYLSFDVFDEPFDDWESLIIRKKKYRFSNYVATHLGDHVRGDLEQNLPFQQTLIRYLSSQVKRNSIIDFRELRWDRNRKGYSLLAVLAMFGLGTLCTLVIRVGRGLEDTYVPQNFTTLIVKRDFARY